MKRLLLTLALCCAPMCAQSTSPITVTVKSGNTQKSWQFVLAAPTSITTFTCTQPPDAQAPSSGTTVLLPGDGSTCSVAIVQGTGSGASPTQIAITVPSPLILSADPNALSGVTLSGGVLSIPVGLSLGTFIVTYPLPTPPTPAAAMQFWPNAWWMWGGNAPVQYYADLSIPCCARADLCGFPVSQVDQSACE